jgi:hypothetical protein
MQMPNEGMCQHVLPTAVLLNTSQYAISIYAQIFNRRYVSAIQQPVKEIQVQSALDRKGKSKEVDCDGQCRG